MPRTTAIVQSNYIPWKGYFDLIRACDHFVIFDDVQFTRRDWRNRNQIKTAQGLHWLTIPVESKGKYLQSIRDTRVSDKGWAAGHWKTIQQNYARAPHFKAGQAWLQPLYERAGGLDFLTDINELFLRAICEHLKIPTKISRSSDYGALPEGKNERLLHVCEAVGTDVYLSGPAAKDYIQPELFGAKKMQVAWMEYGGYPDYPQLHGEFVHGVSAVDLILNVGADAPAFLKPKA